MTRLSTNTASQRDRLESYLRNHLSINTIEARNKLSIMAIAARVFELRRGAKKMNIVTQKVTIDTGMAVHADVANYVLLDGEWRDD